MKNLLIVFLVSTGFLFACSQPQASKEAKVESLTGDEVPAPKTVEYADDTTTSKGKILLADTITYDILVKNPDKNDEYKEECLRRLDRKNLIKIIFKAIYAGKLKPYNYVDNTEASMNDVREFEKKYTRDRIGKMQFVEEWYFDEANLKFSKKIKSVMFGYENYDNEGSVTGYKASFKVNLN